MKIDTLDLNIIFNLLKNTEIIFVFLQNVYYYTVNFIGHSTSDFI
jgi:hypothetical protein